MLLCLMGLVVSPIFAWASDIPVQTKEGYGLIDTAGLQKLLHDQPGLVVIDARNPEEYQEVHIKGAISIPEPKFAEHACLLPTDKAATLVFYCNGVKCGKSKKAAVKAQAFGYKNILVYAEGMPVWEEKGLPIYAGPDCEKKRWKPLRSPPGSLRP